MRHRKIKGKLSRRSGYRIATVRSLVRSLLINEKITTTVVKAKETKRMAEKLITIAREDTLHAHRKVQAFLLDRKLVSKLFKEIAPRFNGRNGGYTRIMRLADTRRGDNAQMAILEFVIMKEEIEPKEKKKQKKKETISDEASEVAEIAETPKSSKATKKKPESVASGKDEEKKIDQKQPSSKEKMEEEVKAEPETLKEGSVKEEKQTKGKEDKKNFLGGLRKFFKTE